MRRTVNVSFSPRPRLPITTPVKIWIRSLSPSTTLVCTRTVSPTPKFAGFLRNCSDSILSSIAWFIKSLLWWRLGAATTDCFEVGQVRSSFERPLLRLFASPFLNLRVVAREQHFRHFQAAKLGRPRVLRIFQQSAVKRLIARTFLVAKRAGQQPRHGINDYHRRQPAVGQHVIADGQFVIGQRLAHPLVKSFIAAANQEQVLLPG